MILLFIGPSGSGKDTQAEILVERYGYKVVSTGDLFRQEIASGSELGKQIAAIINQGNWLGDELTYRILENHLKKIGVEKLILSGAVRTVAQIKLLDVVLSRLDAVLDRVVFFELTEEEAIKRLSGRRYSPSGKMYHVEFKPPKVSGKDDETGEELIQRDDDKPEAIRKRMQEFNRTIKPILQAYEQRGILIRIDASPGIGEVASRLEGQLYAWDAG